MKPNEQCAQSSLAGCGDGIWEIEVPHRVMGIELGRRMTVVRLPEGRLWIHGPVAPTPELRAALQNLGPVHYIVGPNMIHDAYLSEFAGAYPEADFYAAPGLAEANRKLRPSHLLGGTPPPAWSGVLDQHHIGGMPKLNEFVFLHRPSRSLIIADLAFNIRGPKPWLTRKLLKLNGNAYNRFTPTRVFKSLIRDPAALRRSVDHILHWDFQSIIVGHGENVTTNAKAALRDAFAFLV